VSVALDHALGSELVSPATSVALTSAYTVGAGELVVGVGGSASAIAESSHTISDSASNAYTPAASLLASGTRMGVLISASNIAHALTTASTISYAVPSTSTPRVAAAAFTGGAAAAADSSYAAATAAGNSVTAAVTSGVITAGDLAILAVVTAAGVAPSTPSGWSVALSNAGHEVAIFYRVAATTGALSPSSTVAANQWAAAICAFPGPHGAEPIWM
jgi:hypothetical protein